MKWNLFRILLWFSLVFLLFSSSCDKDEPIPAYIFIPDVIFSHNNPAYGTQSSKITDVWVYQNDNPVGVYELPAYFPILGEGNTKLTIEAGIKSNGIGATRIRYLFYTPFNTQLDVSPGEIDTILPTVTYVSNIFFPLIEDFESGFTFGAMSKISNSQEAFEGSSYGQLNTDSLLNNRILSVTSESFVIPRTTAFCTLELNYKCSHPFTVGIVPIIGGIEFAFPDTDLTINPRDEWNKIYINYTPAVQQSEADSYKIFIRYNHSEATNIDDVSILFDNIKLTYYGL